MDYTTLTDEQLDAQRVAILNEQERRARLSLEIQKVRNCSLSLS